MYTRQYTFIFSYICIHKYVFKKSAKKQGYGLTRRVKAVALFFYNKWYHNYVKYICIHNYVTSFFKIIYKENIKLNIKKLKKCRIKFIYKENIKMYLIKIIYKEIEKSI